MGEDAIENNVRPFPTLWDPWFSRRQVAKYFGVSESTVRRWVKDGMPHERVGGVLRFKMSECEAWFRKGDTDV